LGIAAAAALSAVQAAGCASLARAPALAFIDGVEMSEDGFVPLPVERCGSYFVIEARVNDRGPYLFLLDTGATTSVVSRRLADEHPEAERDALTTVRDSTGAVGRIDSAVHIRDFHAGPLRLERLDALVMDLDTVQHAFGGRLDGILGYPAFRDMTVRFDYRAGRVSVAHGGMLGQQAPALGAARFALRHRNEPIIEIDASGVRASMLIDTGSSSLASVTERVVDELGLEPVHFGSHSGVLKSARRRVVTLPGDLRVGPVAVGNATVGVSRKERGLIGAGLLSDSVLTIDQRSGIAQIEAHDAVWVASRPRTIGFDLTWSEGLMHVRAVMPGGPAEAAGLRAGDRLVSVGGVPSDRLACGGLGSALRSREPVLVVFEREGQRRAALLAARRLNPDEMTAALSD